MLLRSAAFVFRRSGLFSLNCALGSQTVFQDVERLDSVHDDAEMSGDHDLQMAHAGSASKTKTVSGCAEIRCTAYESY